MSYFFFFNLLLNLKFKKKKRKKVGKLANGTAKDLDVLCEQVGSMVVYLYFVQTKNPSTESMAVPYGNMLQHTEETYLLDMGDRVR